MAKPHKSAGSRSSGRLSVRASAIIIALVIVVPVSAWWLYEEQRPKRLYAEAVRQVEANPGLAADLLEESIALRAGNYPEAQLSWAQLLLDKGQVLESANVFATIQRPGELNDQELRAFAASSQKAHEPVLAQLILNALSSKGSAQFDDMVLRLELLLSLNRNDQVIDLVAELPPSLEGRSLIAFFSGQAYDQLGQFPQALDEYNTFLGSDSGDSTQRLFALRRCRKLSMYVGNAEHAGHFAEQICLRFPGEMTLSDELEEADIERALGQTAHALKLLNSVLATHPKSVEALRLRAAIFLDELNYNGAESDLREILAQQPMNKEAHYQLAQILLKTDRTDEAQKHLIENRRLNNVALEILRVEAETPTEPDGQRQHFEQLIKLYREAGLAEKAQQLERARIQFAPHNH